jgi:hypothetical protein
MWLLYKPTGRVAGRLDVPNDRQDVGRKLDCLRLTGHAHALDGAGGVGRAHWAHPAAASLAARSPIADQSSLSPP